MVETIFFHLLRFFCVVCLLVGFSGNLSPLDIFVLVPARLEQMEVLLVFRGESSCQGFLGGAGWISSIHGRTMLALKMTNKQDLTNHGFGVEC